MTNYKTDEIWRPTSARQYLLLGPHTLAITPLRDGPPARSKR